MTSRAHPVPWRALAVLTLAVLLAHWLVLRMAPTALDLPESALAKTFITRTVTFAPPPTAPAAPPVVTPQAPRLAPPKPKAATLQPVQTTAAQGGDTATAQAPPEPAASQPQVAQAPVQQPPPHPTPAPKDPLPAAAEPLPPPPPPAALAIPGSVRMQYVVSGQQGRQPMSGVTAEVLWLQDGRTYEARLAYAWMFGTLRSQTSVGAIGPGGLVPERFSDKRRSEVAAHFQRDKSKITFSANTPDVPLLEGAQDRLSLFLQLASLLAGSPKSYPVGSAFSVQTAGPRDADVWVFKVVDEEVLHLPAGEMATVKLQRNPRREFDQTVEMWFAPSLGYLPVRIRLTDANGDMADQRLRSYGPPS